MISQKEKIFGWLLCMPRSEAMEAIASWHSALLVRTATDTAPSSGFAPVVARIGALLTDDGREIIWINGSAWALRPEIHAKRLSEAMEQAKQRDAAIAAQQAQQPKQTAQQTTCPSLLDGQLCGGTLVRAAVCPRCALGKSGVEATLTCDVCGHVTAIIKGGGNG